MHQMPLQSLNHAPMVMRALNLVDQLIDKSIWSNNSQRALLLCSFLLQSGFRRSARCFYTSSLRLWAASTLCHKSSRRRKNHASDSARPWQNGTLTMRLVCDFSTGIFLK